MSVISCVMKIYEIHARYEYVMAARTELCIDQSSFGSSFFRFSFISISCMIFDLHKFTSQYNNQLTMNSSSDDESMADAMLRVSLKLASSVKDRSLEVPTQAIAVPADIGRKGLSAVLNHLLGRSVSSDNNNDSDSDSDDDDSSQDGNKLPPLTFEFIVKGTSNRLLRKGVEKEARQHGLSLEEAIPITYFPAANVPEKQSDGETLPDWISCLETAASNNKFVFSGCYDGSIHAYQRTANNGLTKVDFAVAGGAGPIKAMAVTEMEDKLWIASASLDHSLSIHTFETDKNKNKLHSYGQCVQAENELGSSSSAYTSLDFARSSSNVSNLLASGNGSGKISIWNVKNVAENHTKSSKKRQKSGKSSKHTTSNTPEIAAMVHFENSHSQSVTGLSWGNHSTAQNSHLISGSWDHSIKLWDVEKENCLLTLNGARVVSCLDTSYHSEGVVATGHPDCTIRLWDVRTNNSKNSVLSSDNTFRPSHKAWVSSVQWSQSNAYQLASTSHDGTVKVWDIRSSNPLHTVRTFSKEEKGLSLLWLSAIADGDGDDDDDGSNKEVIFAGGTDCILKRIDV